MSSIKHTFDCWHDGLISTSEILARILTSDLPVAERLEHIATVTLRLAEQEQADAALLYVDAKDAEERDYEEAGGDYVWGRK